MRVDTVEQPEDNLALRRDPAAFVAVARGVLVAPLLGQHLINTDCQLPLPRTKNLPRFGNIAWCPRVQDGNAKISKISPHTEAPDPPLPGLPLCAGAVREQRAC